MALEGRDIKAIFDGELTIEPKISTGFLWLNRKVSSSKDVDELEFILDEAIRLLSLNPGERTPWMNAAEEDTLVFFQRMRNALFCPLEEVPLHIDGPVAFVAKYRLSVGR